jgi:hypothetical protein
MRIISGSMDVTKIDKTKLIEGKNGAKYLNFDIIVNDEPDQYGKDVALTLSQTKDERTAKAKKVYIGNGKTVWKKEADDKPKYEKEEIKINETIRGGITTPDDDSLPF